ncbi:D-lactonohydrolase-like protein [Hymenopellis radicata]|nr:D-lactonohydrolase-like protein [Hymenopellis radicata]
MRSRNVLLMLASAAAGHALPPNTVLIEPSSFAVMGPNATFRQSAFDPAEYFNPTNSSPPFFQAFDVSFFDILGDSPSIHQVAENATWAFAHEGPVYVSETDEVFFASRAGGDLSFSDWDHNNHMCKISMSEIESALEAAGDNAANISVPYTVLDINDDIQMANGGGGPFEGDVLVITSGRGYLPPSIVRLNPYPPYNTTVILDNFFGRQFNSLNDIEVHPSGNLFFTDPTYGYLIRFRPLPLMPTQVYRLDPRTGSVSVVADHFGLPNGIAFSPDGSTAYITDTASRAGFLGVNQTLPATIYAYDVDEETQAFQNRRVFAYIETSVIDGISVDTNGNVYGSATDGVFNSNGMLIGKIYLNENTANMVFAGPGRFLILAETKIYLVRIAAAGIPPVSP